MCETVVFVGVVVFLCGCVVLNVIIAKRREKNNIEDPDVLDLRENKEGSTVWDYDPMTGKIIKTNPKVNKQSSKQEKKED